MDYKDEHELINILSEDTCLEIINVYDEDLNEMARVGVIPDSSLEIHLEGSEGYIPHIHICKNNGKNIICRIKLLDNEYFREKNDKNNTLNIKERKALNDYMHSNIPFSKSKWNLLMDMWNSFNPTRAVDPKKFNIPDYTNIKEPK